MSFQFLPQTIIHHIAMYLDPTDLASFNMVSKSNRNKLNNEEFWQRKTVRDFGHLFQTFQIIHCTGLVLQNDLMLRFTKFKSWQHFYLTKHTNIDTETMEEITNEYRHAKKMLALFRDDFNSSILIEVASKMLWILDFYPYHAGCYYILSLLLFMIHQHEEALDIIDLGREMNPTFHRFNELETQITNTIQNYDIYQVPYLINDNLSPELLKTLLEIFDKFDKDKDRALNPKELDRFVYYTNEQHPSHALLIQIAQQFGANEKGWLTLEGFLAFYLEQTLNDISETERDMLKHGYDTISLKMIPS